MIENPMVMHNGYGIRDPQEYEPIPIEDECGTEVFAGDRILVSPEGDVILKENAAEYLNSVLGFEERTAGERDEFTTKD
ncbi:YqaI family protein [Bacillus cereus group sp. MYBK234-1]|uniref:YqaI family protein n=1 Tax=unclassified Bacillus cereus group TaxID=2750818 RepID=UPI003F793AD1